MRTKSLFTAIAFAAMAVGCSQADSNPATDVSDENISYVAGDVLMGSKDAKVQIIEYASTSCGHCRTFHKTILPSIKENFIDKGLVNLIYRDLPTPPPQLAAAGAAISRCAGKDKYYDVLDDVFTSQGEIFDAAREAKAMEAYIAIGARHDMSAETIRTCIGSSKVLDEIVRTQDMAHEAGVTSTPTLFIDGVKVESQDMSKTAITALLNDALGIETTDESAPADETADSEEAAH